MSIIEDWYSLDGEAKKVEELEKKLELTNEKLQCAEKKLCDAEEKLEQLADQLAKQSTELTAFTHQVKTQQAELLSIIQKHTDEIRVLKANAAESEHLKQTHILLEELKVIKQRELNLLLREKIPVPFFASTETLLTRKIPL